MRQARRKKLQRHDVFRHGHAYKEVQRTLRHVRGMQVKRKPHEFFVRAAPEKFREFEKLSFSSRDFSEPSNI